MTIIVEDGSQVENSNSYSTRADYIAYALTLGVTISDSTTADVQLIKSAEYIMHHEANLKGCRVSRSQSMAYPRTGLYIEGWYWDSDEIPRQVILCQLAFAMDINGGEDLYNRSVNPNQAVIGERVEDVVDVKYSDPGSQKLSKSSSGDALLAALLNNGGLMSIPTTRR